MKKFHLNDEIIVDHYNLSCTLQSLSKFIQEFQIMVTLTHF